MPEENKGNGAVMWGVAVLVVALIAFGGYTLMNKDESVETPVVNSVETPAQNSVETPVVTATYIYKNGTYTSKGSYNSPGGPEQIDVTLVLKDDVIADVTVKSLATLDASKNWQGKFLSGVKAEVVGKKLSEVTLTKVSGSSLTPKGWNDAIAKIQVQAKA